MTDETSAAPKFNARIPESRMRAKDGEDCMAMLDEALNMGVSILNKDLEYQYLSAGVYRQLGIDPSYRRGQEE